MGDTGTGTRISGASLCALSSLRSYSPDSVATSAGFSALVSVVLALCWFVIGRFAAGAICVVMSIAFVGLIYEIGVSMNNERRSLSYALDRALVVVESTMVFVSAVMCLVVAAKGEADAGIIIIWYFVLRWRAHRATGRWRT